VPVEVRPRRFDDIGDSLADRLCEEAPRKDHGRPFGQRDHRRRNGVGAAVKRREDVAKMAESNKAFATTAVSKESL